MEPDTNRPADLQHATTGELVARLSEQVSTLVKSELELAKAELTRKGMRVGVGAGLAGSGGLLGAYGFGLLLAAAVAALALVWPVWLAALVIGVVVLLVAGALALAGRSQLRRSSPPVPKHAVEGVREDVAAVREAMQR
jgi:putative superfamily III holin-X